MLNCQIFQDFTDNKNIKELIDLYNKKCNNGWNINVKSENRWIINFPNKIFYDLINNQAKKISEQIQKIIENISNIESIVYVGGYCSNEILINFFKKKFKNIVHLKPSHPEIAVVKGAVLFGINPNIITQRKAKYSIGLKVRENWEEKIYGKTGQKVYDEKYKCYICEDCFHLFIKIGQTLSINDIIIHNLQMNNPRYGSLNFYKSYKENPILCSEEGVEKIGENLWI